MADRVSAADALHLVRRQRHGFLNHLQVISGWLQLGRPERAAAYLEAVADRMVAESGALRQVPPLLGLTLLELDLEAETHGVELLWQCDGPVEHFSAEALAGLRTQVPAAMAASSGEARRIAVRLTADGFAIHTPPDQGEG